MKILMRYPEENARRYAHRVILDNIVKLELQPGSAVSENELSVALNISRTPVREALIEMRQLGLIEIIPQKGSFVTKIDYSRIEDGKFVRLALENAVVHLACRQGISDGYREKLRRNLEEQKAKIHMENDHDPNRMVELDNEFHGLLFSSVGKERALEFLKPQMVHFDRLRYLTYQKLKDEKNARTVSDHENIMYALEKGDEELAEMVMTLHLTRHQVEKAELIEFCPQYFV